MIFFAILNGVLSQRFDMALPTFQLRSRKNHNPKFSRVRAVQEQGISARRRSRLLRGLNNPVSVPLRFAFGKEHQRIFFLMSNMTVRHLGLT
jgi:hypothetical protein